jgi:hypothetical protein
MIPLVASVSVRNNWQLLLPVALLLLPVMFIACWAGQVNPFETLGVFWQILCGLNGTHIEINEGDASFLIHVF